MKEYAVSQTNGTPILPSAFFPSRTSKAPAMIQAKGFAALSPTTPVVPFSFDRRDPRESDVVIDIQYCGICHSDIHQARDEWGGSIFLMVPGHALAGVVRAVGTKVTRYRVGDHVGVGCFVDSCRHCSSLPAGPESVLPRRRHAHVQRQRESTGRRSARAAIPT